MSDSDDKKNSSRLNPKIGFDVNILKDGSICFGDIPEELLPLLLEMFPDDEQVKRAFETYQQMKKNTSDNTE